MKNLVLNLQKQENSDIKYKINNFPDGQRSITLLNPEELFGKVKVLIVKSICNFSNLELICSAVSVLKTLTNNYAVYAPYIIGARSDRKFEVGGDFYFRDVIEPILKNLNCPIFSANLHCNSNIVISIPDNNLQVTYFSYDCIAYPDESAYMRFCKTYNKIPSCVFTKKRQESGAITQTLLNSDSLYNLKNAKNIFIIDDLFDGGGSFMGIIDKIKNENKTTKITIYITHFIGSNIDNLEKLKENNVRIITTNSYNFSELLTDKFDIIHFDLYSSGKLSSIFKMF